MKNATEIVVILDKSGSMESQKQDAIGGFNRFLREQQAEPEEASLTLVLFDTTYSASPSVALQHVEPLTEITYRPGGSTALLDALGRAIRDTGERLRELPEAVRPDKVIVVTITDGEENASRKFSLSDIRSMIEHQQQEYSWQFLFLGANQDAFAEGGKLGLQPNMVAAFEANSAGYDYAWRSSGKAVREYRKRAAIGEEWKSDDMN